MRPLALCRAMPTLLFTRQDKQFIGIYICTYSRAELRFDPEKIPKVSILVSNESLSYPDYENNMPHLETVGHFL